MTRALSKYLLLADMKGVKMSDVPESAKKTASALTRLIPEIGFDLICRVVPGAALVLVICIVSGYHFKDFHWQHLLIGTIFAFFIGSIVDYFTDVSMIFFSIKLGWRLIDKNATHEELTQLASWCGVSSDKASDSHTNRKRILDTLRSYRRENDPGGQLILAKLIAEERLVKNTMVGLPLSLVFLVLYEPDIFVNAWTWGRGVLLVIIEIVTVLGTWNRAERSVARAIFWWRAKRLGAKELTGEEVKEAEPDA